MGARVGLLLIGGNGANGTLLRTTLTGMRSGAIPEVFGVTSMSPFRQDVLCGAADMVVSGWDVDENSTSQELEVDRMATGILSYFDTKLNDERYWSALKDVGDAARSIRQQIEQFKAVNELDSCIAINLMTPAKRTADGLHNIDISDVQGLPAKECPSAVAYMIGCMSAGATFVDFTPSEVLELGGVDQAAVNYGVQVAGRDGSTGQTWLKLAIASSLMVRNFKIRGWYSSNVLGNRDGLALANPITAETKISDKLAGLNSLEPELASSHGIDITYMPVLKDIKESWDLVEFEDCFGNAGSLRMNWRAYDSPLAVQVLCDLVRLIAHGHTQGRKGLRTDLSLFFKNPIGAMEVSPIRQFDHLLAANPDLVDAGGERRLW
ncbi:hypothetical protein A5722_32380 [Mycobacterium vulneris]|nr:hypothetical protein A5722_32380 [Mycolicibacterium vulneris]OCB67816.1 hypothetical protein A5729_06730 [Mycolicibacterium vulneris]